MKNDDCSRIDSLRKEIINDWDKINLAGKVLITIGLIVFLSTIGLALYNEGPNSVLKTIEVIFRSALSSIFGFVLSSNLKDNKNKDYSVITKNEIEKSIDISEEDCEEEIKIFNYKEGNSVQIMIAFTICIISIVVMLIMYIFSVDHNDATISQFRDLMCSSIGFLLGESKIKK